MTYYEHIYREFDRWDLLAFHYWGDTNLAPYIVLDNPHLSILDSPQIGTIIYIRTTKPTVESPNINLTIPFWKQ
jgi:hypothetical protein